MSDEVESLTEEFTELSSGFTNTIFTEPPNEVTLSVTNLPNLGLPDSFIYPAMATTFILFLIACYLNISVVTFHWTKKRTSIISFIYVILSLSDMFTGLCALLHSFMFLVTWVLGPEQGDLSPEVFAYVVPAHFITQVAFKLSAFVSMVFAVIRTINICKPYYLINKQAVVLSILVYGLIWVGLCVTEMSFILTDYREKLDGDTEALVTRDYVDGFFFQPNSPLLLYYFGLANMKCSLGLFYTILPITFCAIITLITTVIQIIQLRISSKSFGFDKVANNLRRGISITIIHICALFVICAGVTTTVPMDMCFNKEYSYEKGRVYFMGFVPYFVNAAFNPIILVVRVKSLREFVTSSVRRSSGASERKIMLKK